MAMFDNLSEGIKKVFLAGVGAVVIGAEKSQELVDELIKKGELSVEQGKALNEELTRKVKETADGASDEVLKARMSMMTPEERDAWIARAQKIAENLKVEDAEYEVEVTEEAEADDAVEPEVADVETDPEA